MRLYCIEEFKQEIEKLKGMKPYSSIEEDIIDHFIGKSIQELSSGTRLNQSSTTPYIKKRLKGRGGFRTYYLVLIKDENVYLIFIHPKTGPKGSDNITDEAKARFYKLVLEAIQSQNLFEISTQEKKLIFKKK